MDAGLYAHWDRKWQPFDTKCREVQAWRKSRSEEITLAHTQTAFCLTALGLGLGVIALGLERIVSRMRHGRHGLGCVTTQ